MVTFTEEILNGKLHFLCGASMCMWLKFLKISMKEMTFKIAAPSQVFQCLFFKSALSLDVHENQKFLDEQKLIFRKRFTN